MTELFLAIVHRSFSACWLVLAVLLLRLLFKKAPKWLAPALWGLVGLRLVLPSIPSAFSLVPAAAPVTALPQFKTGTAVMGQPSLEVQNIAPANLAVPQRHPVPDLDDLFCWIWLAGMAALLIYTGLSYFRLYHRVRTAVRLKDNIWQSEAVASPFVLGIVRPRIYLPFHLSQKDTELILSHEQAHIRRHDHWWKPLGFAVLTVYWFNPLFWIAYFLFCRDIELACDEKAVKGFDTACRADYSETLLRCSAPRQGVAVCPLAFGELSVKQRVKEVLSYKKPALWLVILAVLAAVLAALLFATDPAKSVFDFKKNPIQTVHTFYENAQMNSNAKEAFLDAEKIEELTAQLQQLDQTHKLHKTDASAPKLDENGFSVDVTLLDGEQIFIDGLYEGRAHFRISTLPGKMYETDDPEFCKYMEALCMAGDQIQADDIPETEEADAESFLTQPAGALDPAVEAAVREQLQKKDGELTKQDLLNVTCLSFQGAGIKTIPELPELPNLRELLMDDNQISDLKPLEKLTKLERLYLAGNPVQDVRPLAGLTGLRVLDLSATAVKDAAPLASLENLEWLDLYGSEVTDAEPLKNLPKLAELRIGDEPVFNKKFKALADAWQTLWKEQLKEWSGISNGDALPFGADLTGDGQNEVVILNDSHRSAGRISTATVWQLTEQGPVLLGKFDAPGFYLQMRQDYELYQGENGNILHTWVLMEERKKDGWIPVWEQFVSLDEEGRMHTDTLSLEWNRKANELRYFESIEKRKDISKQEYEQRKMQLLNGGTMIKIIRQNQTGPICPFGQEPERFEKLLEIAGMDGGQGFLICDPREGPIPEGIGANHPWQPEYEKMQ